MFLAGPLICDPVSAAVTNVNPTMTNGDIQTQIDGAGVGDTINFLAGVYSSITLNINKALNLVSTGAILNSAAGSTILTLDGLNSSGTNITGFTFNGNGEGYAITAANTNTLLIKNNTFNNNMRGIYFSKVNESSIKSNKIYNNSEYGIYIVDWGNMVNRDGINIDQNIIINSTGGIHAEGSFYNITNNYIDGYFQYLNGLDGLYLYSALIKNNTIINIDDGININHAYQNLTIVDNYICNMTNASNGNHDGISLVNRGAMETATQTVVANNTVDNVYYGMFIGGNFNGNVYGNLLNNTRIDGIQITGKGTATDGTLYANITNNTITHADGLGIAMQNHNVKYLQIINNTIDSMDYSIQYNVNYRNNGDVTVSGNTFTQPQEYIVSSSMSSNYIQSLIDGSLSGDMITFMKGTYNGIALTINHALNLVSMGAILNASGNSSPVITITGAASGTNITGFTLTGSNTSGLNIDSVSNVTVSGNNITGNNVGINVKNSQNSTVKDNIINGNTNEGADLSDGASGNLLTENSVHGNGGDGVNVKDSNSNKINNNNITQNKGDGIEVNESNNNTVTGNTVSSNGGNGISVESSVNNHISDNTITKNTKKGIKANTTVITENNITDNSISGNGETVVVDGVNPVNGAVNVPINKNIIVTFGDNVKWGNSWVELQMSNGTPVAVTKSINGNNLIITPTGILSYGTNYLVLLHSGSVTDLAGNPLNAYMSTFTVVPTITVTAVDPVNGAVGVANNKTVIVTFNKDVKWGSGWVELQTSTGTPVSFTKSIVGNTLTINPSGALSCGVKYLVLLHSGSLTDLSGNAISSYLSSFTVTPAPVVSSVDPVNGAVGVANNKTVIVTFNKDVKWGSGWVELQMSNGTSVAFTKSIVGNTLTINPSGALSCGVKYLVLLHTGSLTDLFGNVVSSYLSSFTVTPAPVVSSVDPVNGAVGVPTSKVITVTFNKAVKLGSGWVELQMSNGTAVSFTKSIVGNTLTITPTSALSTGVKYMVLLHTGSLMDLFGNAVSSYLSMFTTKSA